MEVIVAPYEADAQMAFLAKSRSVHAVITEDSDLLTYGCPRVRTLQRMLWRVCALSVAVLHTFHMLVQHAGESVLDVTHLSCQPPPQPLHTWDTLWYARR